ncbi:hypothetical protein SBOR_9252 [Sclerotinia borealis F-4128]|uniref:Uncharacterized protein n=1 Tax=Sclerotinia borealis (strain F-4128) TaxID=1432307 RepID=W9C3C6_SCLBF|nr:hypothetical protein SBOR_9252 [Sclerotinia borealis F-4128]
MDQSLELRNDIYQRQYEDGAWIYRLVDYKRKLLTTERLRITHTSPAILGESRYHTTEELEKAGYLFMEGGEKHQFEAQHPDKPPTRFTNHLRLSERELEQCGLLKELGELRQIALNPEFQQGLATTMKRKYPDYASRKGMHYEIGVTRQPGHGPRRLQMAEILRKDADGSKKDFLHRARILGQKLLDIWIPEYKNTHAFQEAEWHRNAAMTFGTDTNTTLNSMQLNYTKQGTSLAASLKGKAHLHCDKDDQPTSYSIVFFMSNFDDWYCPGHFINTTWRTIFPASPFQVYIFSGRTWHYGAGAGPYPGWVGPGHPLRLPAPSVQLPVLESTAADNKMRCNMVVYPTRRLLNPAFKEANVELWQPNGRHVFESIQTQQEWKLRLFIKQEVLFKIVAALQTDELLQNRFPEWIRNWWWMMTFAPDMFWHGAGDVSDDAENSALAYFKQLEEEKRKNNAGEEDNEQNGDANLQSTAPNKKYWPTKSERVITKAFATHYEELAEEWECLRTYDPDWFIEKFWWIDPTTGTKTYPSRNIAMKTIAAIAAGPSKQLKDLEEDLAQAYDGFGDYEGETIFTELESPRAFDPAVDTVPANPGWVPTPDWEPAAVEEGVEVDNVQG